MQHFPEIAAVINFFVLLGALVYFGRKPFSGYLEERKDTITKNVEESERLSKEALLLFQTFQEKLSKLDRESQDLLEQAKRDGELARKEILERAERMSAQIIENAKNAAAREIERQKAKLQKELLEKVILESIDILKKQASEKDHKAFTEHFVQSMQKQYGNLN